MAKPLSKWTIDDAIGGLWLSLRYGVEPVQPLRYRSRVALSRATHLNRNTWEVRYTEQYRPEPTFRGHLEFMIRHERISLEFLARLFKVTGKEEITEWVRDQPTGQYARRAGFLYEWLTGNLLDFSGVTNGAYVNAFDEDRYWTAGRATNDKRWRVRDNLPGDRRFCPVVLLTEGVRDAAGLDIAADWKDLENEFGAELLARSAVWLTLKESRASFAIEGEGGQTDRIQRFAAVMESEIGRHPDVFDPGTLEMLQREIVGPHATAHGIRRSPIFVGETRGSQEIVHYIAPRWDVATDMLEGLTQCANVTAGGSPLVRATALSFGFVYAHPLTDGNGRISRFLINDVFRRDGVLPEPFVLPVSAVISGAMRDYDRILETLSKPLMQRYSGDYRFGKDVAYEDGRTSNLHFDAYEDAEPTWRYPDLTDHVEYMAEVVRVTIEQEMRKEAREMRAYRGARAAIKEIVEGPDPDLDRIVRSISHNGWKISGKLVSDFPVLEDDDLASRIVAAVQTAFAEA